MTIELARPGFRTTAAGVEADDSMVGPDYVVVHSTESGRFLPTERDEMREFVLATRLGAFDGVLDPDVPVHPSASADAPCPLDRTKPYDRDFIRTEFEVYRIIFIRAEHLREALADGADSLDLLMAEYNRIVESGMTREQTAAALASILMRVAQGEPVLIRTQPVEPELQKLRRELVDYKRLFDMQWRRMGEATERWRAEDPENRGHIMPDLGDLLAWLMAQIDKARAVADPICREAVQRMRTLGEILNDPGEIAHLNRTELYGEIHGLRVALCLVMGWDPTTDADKEGRADDHIKAWHNRTFPDEGPW